MGPYQVLEEHLNDIENELKPYVEYLCNMHRIAIIEQIMVSECKRIYENIKNDFNNISDKVWIIHNLSLMEKSVEKPDIEMALLLEDNTIKSNVPYLGSTFS